MLTGPRGLQGWRLDALLGLLCVVAFGPGMSAALIHYDDNLYITDNLQVMARPGLDGLLNVWSSARAWRGEFVEYFPLRDTVYWLIFQRWQTAGLPYHLVSLAFHLVSSLLVVRLVRQLGLSMWATAMAAVLFAIHPIHTESVQWAAGLKDPMYTALMLGSLLAYQRYRQTTRFTWYAAMLVLLSLSLLVKSMAVSTVLLLVALERLNGVATEWKVIAKRLAAPMVVCGLFLVQFIAVGRANQVVIGPHGGTWASHLVLTLWAQVNYLRLSLLPSGFRLVYCFEPVSGLSDVRLWVGVGLACAVGVGLWRARRHSLLMFCAAWYAACLLPVSNVIPFPAVVADRYLYAAVLGVCVAGAWALEQLQPRLRGPLSVLLALLLVAISAFRSADWQTEDNLWADADEDPACLTDVSTAATQAHITRYWTTANRDEGYRALQRAMASPGLVRMPVQNRCLGLNLFTAEATRRGDFAPAATASQWAERDCSDLPDTWRASMKLALHRDPKRAAEAAERMHRLLDTPWTRVMQALTRLEMNDETAVATVTALSWHKPRETCPDILEWVQAVPAHATLLHDAVTSCESVVRPGATP